MNFGKEYIKTFESHSDYEAFTASTEFIRPNVSYCVSENEVHYNPIIETRVVAKYNVADTSNPTPIGCYNYISGFSVIEIDGVELPSVVSAYTFDTVGEHTVKYTLTDPTSIGDSAFKNCTSLTSIDIPSGVTRIGAAAFYYCTKLTSIVSNATTAPSIYVGTFQSVKPGGTLTVPSGSTGYDTWMKTSSYYLGYYNWTKVEQ